MSSEKKQINNRIFQLEIYILPLLFPGHQQRKHGIEETKKWILEMKNILTRVDNYINKNLYHTAEFSIYYDKDHVKKELYPFKSFVDNVIEIKQWAHIPGVRNIRQKEAKKLESELGQQDQVVGMLEFIQFHISLLRTIFEQLVEKEYKVDKELEQLLPLTQEKRRVYENFWFPVKHPHKKPQTTQNQRQRKRTKTQNK